MMSVLYNLLPVGYLMGVLYVLKNTSCQSNWKKILIYVWVFPNINSFVYTHTYTLAESKLLL